MSKHSEGQHSRKLHKIVPKADEEQIQTEGPSLNSDWQPGQVKCTNSCQVQATSGTKSAKETDGCKKEATRHAIGSKPSNHGHNKIEKLKEIAKKRLLRPSKTRNPVNTRLRESRSVNDLPSISGQVGCSSLGRQCHDHAYYYETGVAGVTESYGVNQIDNLIAELEDTREQLKQSLEEKARLQFENNHLADELYNKFKVSQMAEQNGTAVGTEISADSSFLVQGSGHSHLSKNGIAYYEHNDVSIVRSKEALEGQLKILQDQINKLEQCLEIHKSECQATAAQFSEFNTSVMKCLCEMTTLQKAIQKTSKDCFAKMQMALKSKSVENEHLRKLVQEYKTEMDTLVQQVNSTMEEEWSELQEKQDKLEMERKRLSQKPIMELKTQIIQLRCGYEQKITKLQEETKKLEEDNAALEHKYTDLRDKFDVKQEQAIGEHSSSNMEHTPETRHPNNPARNQEGRTTHLERVVNELQLDMQKVQHGLQSRASPPTTLGRSPSPSPVAVIKPISQNVDTGDKEEHSIDRPFDPNLVCPECRKQFRIGEIQEYRKHYHEDCQLTQRQIEQEPIQMNSVIPSGQTMTGDTPPFIPIIPSIKGHPEMNEVMPEPKLLCLTPGCSFKGYEDLGGLCPDCSGQGDC